MFRSDFNRSGTMPDYLEVRGEIVVVALFLLLVVGRRIALAEHIPRLAADRFDVDVLAFGAAGVDEALGRLDDVRIEGTGKALVASDDDDQDVLLFALDQQWVKDLA